MKKYLLVIVILFVQLLQAQEQSENNTNSILNDKNEIRLDVGQIIYNGKLKVAYERFLNKDFSAGVSVIYFGDNYSSSFYFNQDLRKKFSIEPFVRYSISKNVERFFYLEGYSTMESGAFGKTKRFSDGEYAFYESAESRFTNVALGVAIGYKFYIKKHFCMDFNFGLSSFIYNNSNTQPLPKFGINAGYRF